MVLELLNGSVERGLVFTTVTTADPEFEIFRDDPEIQALLEKLRGR